MDAIILAAGRNDRLKGYVPAYLKPLILINGEPLIVTLAQELMLHTEGKIVVVVAPQNAAQIVEVVETRLGHHNRTRYVLQPQASGPAGALRLGVEVVNDGSAVMLVCADNVIPPDDFSECTSAYYHSMGTAVCTRELPRAEAERFTRVYEDRVIEGPLSPGEREDTGPFKCWVGPLVFNTKRLLNAISDQPNTSLVSAYLNKAGPLTPVDGNTSDIGVPEAL